MKSWSLPLFVCLIGSSLSLSKGRKVRSSPSTSACIEKFLDENVDAVVVSDCVCDPTCEVCGYYGEAVSGPKDCFTCHEGFLHTQIFDDGSGTCTSSDNFDPTMDPVETLPQSTTVIQAPTDNASSPRTSHRAARTADSRATAGGICLIVYQLADTSVLEPSIREDLFEITISPITQSLFTTTWVYHDGLDPGDSEYTGGPLTNVYNPDGTELTESFGGSRYFTWDHDLGAMVVNGTFSSELNSDDPSVLQDFVTYALTDCIAQGKSEYFLALSSHGGGFIGFGGDNDNARLRRRKLTQPTADVFSAIQGALSSVAGAPSQLDVLGFDACLMQSVDALDDFASIAKYYLASEAVEPGHGWAYNELSETDVAVNLAMDVVNTFVESMHGYSDHATPKTLAVVDTTAFLAFRDAWDALCSEIADILGSGNDADFHASLIRARAKTVAFEGALVAQVQTSMDVGDFVAQLSELCVPDESSQLYALMTNANDAYKAMFVITRNGPGTPRGTGMSITWVSKQEFLNNPDFYGQFIFPSSGSLPLTGAPNYSRMLALYYNSSTPADNVGTSVCGTSADASRSVASPDELLLGPDIFFVEPSTIEVRAEITRSVDYVLVEFGINLNHLLDDTRLRRRLDESVRRQRANKAENGGEVTTRSSFARHQQEMKWRYSDIFEKAAERRLQDASGDRFYLYGGSVDVELNGPNVTAAWDSTYYWIESGDDLEPVYAVDVGGGLKSIPVCFFDQNNPVTSDQIPTGVTVEDAITNLGCKEGYLSFSVAEDSDGHINLYAYNGNTVSEVSVAAGQSIVPILYIELSVDGEVVTELLGGLNSVVIPWTPESNVTVYGSSDSFNLEVFGSDIAFLKIYAYDEDLKIIDSSLHEYTYNSNSTENPNDPADTDDPDDGSTSKGSKGPLAIGITTLMLICSTTMIFVSTLL